MLALSNSTAWATGLFEGEGTIFIKLNKQKGKCYPHLSLSMTDKDVVEKFAKAVGSSHITGPYKSKSNPHWKPRYQWFCGRKEDVIRILNDFLPYLGERRACKALDALDVYDGIYTKQELFKLQQ